MRVDRSALLESADDGVVFTFCLPKPCGVPNVAGKVGLNKGAGDEAGLAVLLPVFPLALSTFKVLLFNKAFSMVGLADGLVVSAAALLWPAAAREEVEVVVAEVEAGLLIAPLYKLRNDEATAEVAVESIAIGVGTVGMGWLTGSRPSRMRLALRLSFSHACANICSACTDVKCAGVGRTVESQALPLPGVFPLPLVGTSPLTFLFLLQLFKYVLILLRARSANSGN